MINVDPRRLRRPVVHLIQTMIITVLRVVVPDILIDITRRPLRKTLGTFFSTCMIFFFLNNYLIIIY